MFILASGPPPVAHARPSGLKRHSRGKRHSRREIFQKFFFQFSKFYIFLVIPRSWGVHRYPWFENRSINMAREEADKQTHIHCTLLYRFSSNYKIPLPGSICHKEYAHFGAHGCSYQVVRGGHLKKCPRIMGSLLPFILTLGPRS